MTVAILDRFLETATSARKWRTVRRVERRLERAVQRAFRAQGRQFVKAFGKVRSRFAESKWLQESITDDDWVGIWDDVAGRTAQLFINPIRRAIQLSLAAAAEELIADIEVDYFFSLRNPRAVAYIAEHGADLVTGINETTRDYLRTIVRQGSDEGWSYNRMAKAISDRFVEFAVGKPQEHIESRAHLVAITGVGNAYEAGNEIVVNDLAAAGLTMEKKWLTVGDDNVSDGCQENERAGWIPVDEAFPSGDMRPLRFPGCRCTALYRRARS